MESAAAVGKLKQYSVEQLREWSKTLGLEDSVSKDQLCIGIYTHFGVQLDLTDVHRTHPDDVLTQLETLKKTTPEEFEQAKQIIHYAAVALSKTRKRAAEIRADVDAKKQEIERMATEFQEQTESLNLSKMEEYAKTMTMLVSQREASELEERTYAAHIHDIETKIGPLRSVFSGGCCICFEGYNSTDHIPMAMDPCFHVVCEQCVPSLGPKCPQCRKQRKKLHRLYV
jgi:hypothetical protein